MSERVTALAGGVGAARLLRGIARVLPLERLSVIVNTGDDEEFFGLHVSPDLDTIVYNLAGTAPRDRGWGIDGDSHHTLAALQRFYRRGWFALGDRDLATHIFRTHSIASGRPLHRVTAAIGSAFGLRARVLPMSNDPVRTFVHTRRGLRMPFQEYFVRHRARPPIARLSYRGLRAAHPAPGVLEAIRRADLLLLPPSNPFTSIRPILGVGKVERTLRERRSPLVAVSPVAGGKAVRGPLGQMLRAAGYSVSPVSIASLYRGLLDGMVIDSADRALGAELERRGITVVTAHIRMDTMASSVAVARTTLELGRRLRKRMG